MTIEVRLLDELARRDSFDCGVPSLDDWLKHQAGQAQRKRLASVWIATATEDPSRVLGFYSLAPWQITFQDCPPALRKRLPRYPIHGTLIARLAVASSEQGQGLGSVLLVDALRRIWKASESVPVQAAIVHALDDGAAEFYRLHGFLAFPENPRNRFLPMKTVADLFEAGSE